MTPISGLASCCFGNSRDSVEVMSSGCNSTASVQRNGGRSGVLSGYVIDREEVMQIREALEFNFVPQTIESLEHATSAPKLDCSGSHLENVAGKTSSEKTS